jgi:hypothetical protein
LPACFDQSVIAENLAGKDACAPRMFALTLCMRSFGKPRMSARPSRRDFHCFRASRHDMKAPQTIPEGIVNGAHRS